MFHPVHTFINKTVRDFTARPVLQDIFIEGKRVYELPVLNEIKRIYKRKSRFTVGRVQTRLESAKISGRSIY